MEMRGESDQKKKSIEASDEVVPSCSLAPTTLPSLLAPGIGQSIPFYNLAGRIPTTGLPLTRA